MRVGFPQPVRDYLATIPVQTGVVWERDGLPRIVIKLPETTAFSSSLVTFGSLHRDVSSTFHVALHLQQGKGHPPMEVDCLIRPAALPDIQALRVLIAVRQIEIYAVSPTLAYLGVQVRSWSANKRGQLATLARDLLAAETQVASPELERPRATRVAIPPLSPLHATYRRTLHQLHDGREGDLLSNSEPAAATSQPQARHVQLDPAVEELLLARAHLVVLPSRKATLFAQVIEDDLAPEEISFPNHPCWIECPHPIAIAGYTRGRFAVFCTRATHESRPIYMHDGQASYRTYLSKSPWRLDFVDEHGGRFLRLFSYPSAGRTGWELDTSHICPTQTCRGQGDLPPMQITSSPQLCAACQREADFWCLESNALLAIAWQQLSTRKHVQPASLTAAQARQGQPASSAPAAQKEVDSNRQLWQGIASQAPALPPAASASPVAPEPWVHQEMPHAPPLRKPVIVAPSLLIERYAERQRGTRRQEAIEQANKYLWMQSAWTMTEALRSAISADTLLQLPPNNLYIELEQPHQVYGQQFAACSLLHASGNVQEFQRWHYSIIDAVGNTIWDMFYEVDPRRHRGNWTVSKEHTCPEQHCQVEDAETGRVFHLCEVCQERATHYTSWLAIALRMLAGDFREQVEVREPEELLETSTRTVQDKTTGEEREKRVLYRFKVIRYYDACVRRDGQPQTKRGSWMANRPLAESEYEVNPAAIIYVLIQPSKYQRTYRHHRYTHMRGKTQQIDPNVRAQPMTMATFRQLHQFQQIQRITRVSASTYEEMA